MLIIFGNFIFQKHLSDQSDAFSLQYYILTKYEQLAARSRLSAVKSESSLIVI